MARVTMKDVAQVCGVSVMSVSNAFNRPDQLSADLRDRILQRAEKMGYAGPDARARTLRTGRSNTYGVLFAEPLGYAFTDPFATRWLAGFAEAMEERGASVLLLPVPAGAPGALEAVQNAAIDGVAGLCASETALDAARRRGMPVVVSTASSEGDQVIMDDYAAARELGSHIRRLGHDRVVIVVETRATGDMPHELEPAAFAAFVAQERDQVFLDTWDRWRGLTEALAGAEVSVVLADGNTRALGAACGPVLFDRADRPTAVIALSDVLALGVLDALATRGLTPGRDVSVAGFDDLPDLAERAGLTTIRQPIHDKGRLAAELLLDPERRPRRVTLPHELVVRRSTGPAPQA